MQQLSIIEGTMEHQNDLITNVDSDDGLTTED